MNRLKLFKNLTIAKDCFLIVAIILTAHFICNQPYAESGQDTGLNIRGDVNCDDNVDISDPIYLLTYLFLTGTPPCPIDDPTCASKLSQVEDELNKAKAEIEYLKRNSISTTNQEKCYNSSGDEIDCQDDQFPGQDGSYQLGCPSSDRFIVNANGTISDKCTNLMWQEVSQNGFNWQESLTLAQESTHAGYSDWRVPNIKELSTIIDYSKIWDPPGNSTNGAIDSIFKGVIGTTWSSTTFKGNTAQAWYVHFQTGHVFYEVEKSHKRVVRLVRNY